MSAFVEETMERVRSHNPGEPAFHQAVQEVAESVELVVARDARYADTKILERLTEPQRAISFAVPWVDDAGEVHLNRGYRVQHSNTLGPFKGGLRFHPSVTLGVMKFLAFEQTFKNSLTMLSLGGGKGGSDFDPKGRSDVEVMRFCQSFMTELSRYLGPDRDVPAGDIGVGARELGYLYGQYKRLSGVYDGSLTGKRLAWGGSTLRPEATGYGLVYFASHMLETRGEKLDGKTCLVSGSGNVAQFATEKLIELDAKPITLSDSGGFIHDPDGITTEKLEFVKELKNVRRGRISEYVEQFPNATYTEALTDADHNPMWAIPADMAMPCATQNEIQAADAVALVDNGIQLVAEGANMPSTPDAMETLVGADALFGPAKAANAGGVAVSGLEMAQNAQRMQWSRGQVDEHLHRIMKNIHGTCVERAEQYGVPGNYVHGANIGGFLRVADSMIDQGVV